MGAYFSNQKHFLVDEIFPDSLSFEKRLKFSLAIVAYENLSSDFRGYYINILIIYQMTIL